MCRHTRCRPHAKSTRLGDVRIGRSRARTRRAPSWRHVSSSWCRRVHPGGAPHTPRWCSPTYACVSAQSARGNPATAVNTNHKHVSTVKKMLVFFSRRREKQQITVACATRRGVTAVTSPCGSPHFSQHVPMPRWQRGGNVKRTRSGNVKSNFPARLIRERRWRHGARVSAAERQSARVYEEFGSAREI